MNYEKRGYLLENFRLFHLQSRQQERVNLHYHEFCKLVMLVSGKGFYTVDGHRYSLQPGDTVLVGSRSVHRPEMESGSVYERIIIYISPEFLQRESSPDCELSAIFSGAQGHVLRLSEARRRAVFELVTELEAELSGDAYGRAILSHAALLRLLVRIAREQQRKSAPELQPVPAESPRVRALIAHIDAHLSEDLDVDTLAQTFYVSKYHMMRQFHRETGLTIHNYLTQRRLLHARELIEKGLRATDACYRSGFRSYSSFTRACGKYFGTTPTGRVDRALIREEAAE